MPDDGTTIGIWIGENDDVLETFDDALECGPRYPGSRSAEVKEAMRLASTVEETLDNLDYGFDSPQSKRHFVTQAILDHARREAER